MPISKASSNAVAAAAKGDLVVGNATNDSGVLAVGTADQVLTVDSSTATGLKWATASAGGMTLISTTTLSGSSTSLSSIPQTYKHLFCVYNAAGSSSGPLFLKINNNSNYYSYSASLITGGAFTDGTSGSSGSEGFAIMQVGSNLNGTTWIPSYTTSDVKFQNTVGSRDNRQILSTGYWNDSAAITSLQFQSGGSLSGKVYLYGVS
jgi:hypothetical protein